MQSSYTFITLTVSVAAAPGNQSATMRILAVLSSQADSGGQPAQPIGAMRQDTAL